MSDLISRQAAIRWVKTECNPFGMPTLDFESGKKVVDHLDQMPSAQPEPKRGKWKTAYLDHVSMGNRPKVLYCSECNQCIAYPTNFCPNCGADMRGEEDG